MTTQEQVDQLLAEIKAENAKDRPNRKKIRDLFWEVRKLKGDWRNTYTGQDAKFLTHTSTREWGE